METTQTATVIKSYTAELHAVAINGKVAVATVTATGTVGVECDQHLTDAERVAVAVAVA